MSAGALEIFAESENARSQFLNVDIPSPTGEETTPSPTVEPTQTPTLVAPTPTPPATSITSAPEVEAAEKPGVGEWILAVMLSLGISVGIYRLAAQMRRFRWGLRAGLLGLIGGLLAYISFMMNLPGSKLLGEISSPWNILLSSSIGISIGVIIALVWLVVSNSIQNNKN
jgi:hypothetical protein